jgi:hypothetical protein
VAGFCEHGNELLGSVKEGEFFETSRQTILGLLSPMPHYAS